MSNDKYTEVVISIEDARDCAVKWIEMHISKMENLFAENSNFKFDFYKYVSEVETKADGTACGTMCCAEGWLPVIMPSFAEYSCTNDFLKEDFIHVTIHDKIRRECFSPSSIGGTINKSLWKLMTIHGFGEFVFKSNRGVVNCAVYPNGPLINSFEDLKAYWILLCEWLVSGELDHYLLKSWQVD